MGGSHSHGNRIQKQSASISYMAVVSPGWEPDGREVWELFMAVLLLGLIVADSVNQQACRMLDLLKLVGKGSVICSADLQ